MQAPVAMTTQQIRIASLNNPELVNPSPAIKGGDYEEICFGKCEKYANELSEKDCIILHHNRIIIPKSLQRTVIASPHIEHLGIIKAKQHLRTKVFWLSIDATVEEAISNCLPCQAVIKL